MRRDCWRNLGDMMKRGTVAYCKHDLIVAHVDVEISAFSRKEMLPVPRQLVWIAGLHMPAQIHIDVLANPGENLMQHVNAIAFDNEVYRRVDRSVEVHMHIAVLLIAEGCFRLLLHALAYIGTCRQSLFRP